MKNLFIFAFALTLSHLAVAAPTPAQEENRQRALGNSRDAIERMDASTPEELEQELGLKEDLFAEVAPDAQAAYVVRINVSIGSQTLTISSPSGSFSTAISSARPGYHTRTGCFARPRLEAMHYSSIYDNSPMPHSMFYSGGYAIHGTYEEGHLGSPASHGCVRVSRSAAAQLFSIVQRFGARNTLICVR